VLTSALVIKVEQVSRQTAAAYLRRCLPPRPGDAWEQILKSLETSTPPSGSLAALAGICTTPLGLWLVRTVYVGRRADVSELLNQDAFPHEAALRAHLFDHLIEALIEARKPSADPAELFRPRRRHDPILVRKWLSYLAHLMNQPRDESAPTRDFAWWHLARITGLTTTPIRIVMGLGLGLGLGLFFGGLFWIPVGSTIETVSLFGSGFMLGFSIGAVTWDIDEWLREDPGFMELRVPSRGPSIGQRSTGGHRSARARGVIVIALSTAALMAPLVDEFGWLEGIVLGLLGLFAIVAFVFLKGMESPASANSATTPRSGWRANRALNIFWFVIFGVAGAVAEVLAIGLKIRAFTGELIAFGLIVFPVFGLLMGPMFAGHRAWLAYLAATYRLAYLGRLPRNLMPFLDDVHRLGLLRAVGPIYQFRHAELQDHLATVYEREYLKRK